MINSVSFRAGLQADSSAKGMLDAPQKYQRTTPYSPVPQASPKKKTGRKIAVAVVSLVAAATALAIAAKKGVLKPGTLAPDAAWYKRAGNKVMTGLNNAGNFIADKATACWNFVKNLLPKKSSVPTP